MTADALAKAVISAAAGTFVGWAGSALTISGRVDAMERTLQRIELRIDEAVIARTAPPQPTPRPVHVAPDPQAR